MPFAKHMKLVGLLYTFILLGPASGLAGYQSLPDNGEETITVTEYICPPTLSVIPNVNTATTAAFQPVPVPSAPPPSGSSPQVKPSGFDLPHGEQPGLLGPLEPNPPDILMTTSTVYSTTIYTIIKCKHTVKNCPAHSTVLITNTIAVYTTVCPAEATATRTSPVSPATSSSPCSTCLPVAPSSTAADTPNNPYTTTSLTSMPSVTSSPTSSSKGFSSFIFTNTSSTFTTSIEITSTITILSSSSVSSTFSSTTSSSAVSSSSSVSSTSSSSSTSSAAFSSSSSSSASSSISSSSSSSSISSSTSASSSISSSTISSSSSSSSVSSTTSSSSSSSSSASSSTSSSSSISSTETSTSATSTPTFTCDAHGYLIQSGTSSTSSLYSVDLDTGVVTTVTKSVGGFSVINAIGYNVLDNYLYGFAQDQSYIVRITTAGVTQVITQVMQSGVVVGDIDTSGYYWYIDSAAWYKMDLIPGSATYGEIVAFGAQSVPPGYNVNDWVYLPGQGDYLYTVASNPGDYGALMRFSMIAHTWEILTVYSTSDLLNTGLIGAFYGASNATFWGSINSSGKIIQFTLTGTPHLSSQGPISSSNDGARCSLALN